MTDQDKSEPVDVFGWEAYSDGNLIEQKLTKAAYFQWLRGNEPHDVDGRAFIGGFQAGWNSLRAFLLSDVQLKEELD